MRREYTREQYLERIDWIRQSRRPIAISTDIIVGFPGETESDFEQTVNLLDEVCYDSIFSFQYSPRPNTASLDFEDTIPEEEKALRLRVLQDRQRNIQIERNQSFVGTVEEVLVEGVNKHEEQGKTQWKGRTTQNMVLNFTIPEDCNAPVSPGEYRQVRVAKAGPNSLAGEAIGEAFVRAHPGLVKLFTRDAAANPLRVL
jgi:tRNA-2-methylthio-N6-dimethylallyladenosine synthase